MWPPFEAIARSGEPAKFSAYTTTPVIVGIGDIITPTGLSANFVDALLVFFF